MSILGVVGAGAWWDPCRNALQSPSGVVGVRSSSRVVVSLLRPPVVMESILRGASLDIRSIVVIVERDPWSGTWAWSFPTTTAWRVEFRVSGTRALASVLQPFSHSNKWIMTMLFLSMASVNNNENSNTVVGVRCAVITAGHGLPLSEHRPICRLICSIICLASLAYRWTLGCLLPLSPCLYRWEYVH